MSKDAEPYRWRNVVGQPSAGARAVAGALNTAADAIGDLSKALDYLAEFFADDLVALRQQRIHSFNPPAAFVDRVIAKMVEDGASVESARMDLADLWPDAAALDDYPRTV